VKIKLLKDCIFTGFEESISEANFKHSTEPCSESNICEFFTYQFFSLFICRTWKADRWAIKLLFLNKKQKTNLFSLSS